MLIAGGADFLSIAIESNYKSWIDASVFDFKAGSKKARLNTDLGKPTKEQLATLSSVYLEHSKLDAFHTATELGDIPVLMLHASLDQAVPASSGELLYTQLGEPDRWSYPLGHELIFAGLPTQVARDRSLDHQACARCSRGLSFYSSSRNCPTTLHWPMRSFGFSASSTKTSPVW